ncbi:hypothetical protein AWB68_06613 [Caballeronia choica]|uniref:Uncharacterized protein n=1 Tax=Caballeronia choica TaxID=326476 RepID=A0A158KNH8_9BURK|nr:hypothetical protein AWB68_06613 [Caballeronia choica]
MIPFLEPPFTFVFGVCVAAFPALAFPDECAEVRAATAFGQRDFVPHIVGEDTRHSERVDGEAMYHIAHSPMPDLLRCDVVASGLTPVLQCIPAESNLIPSVARQRTNRAATVISRCVQEPVIGPLKSPSESGHLQWFVTDWREYRPIRYRIDWSPTLTEPAWTLKAGPVIENTSYIGRATRARKLHDSTSAGRPCRQLLNAVQSAQTDFRRTIGKLAEKADDLALYTSSLSLMDFSVEVGVGGTTPNMLFAERAVSSVMNLRKRRKWAGWQAARSAHACRRVLSASPTSSTATAASNWSGGLPTTTLRGQCPYLLSCVSSPGAAASVEPRYASSVGSDAGGTAISRRV